LLNKASNKTVSHQVASKLHRNTSVSLVSAQPALAECCAMSCQLGGLPVLFWTILYTSTQWVVHKLQKMPCDATTACKCSNVVWATNYQFSTQTTYEARNSQQLQNCWLSDWKLLVLAFKACKQ